MVYVLVIARGGKIFLYEHRSGKLSQTKWSFPAAKLTSLGDEPFYRQTSKQQECIKNQGRC